MTDDASFLLARLARPGSSLAPGYLRLRLGAAASALRIFLRRWGVYAGVAAAAFGAGASGGLLSIAAAAAWTVLPLWQAIAQGPWWRAVSCGLAQAVVGVVLLRALRPLVWPAHWRAQERALPIAPTELWRADAVLSLAALSPWLALQALGAAVLWWQHPAWLQPVRGSALTALCAAQALALGTGWWGLRRWRRHGLQGARRIVQRGGGRPGMLAPWRALLWLSWWRAADGATARAGLWSATVLLVPAALACWRPSWLAWWLVAWVIVSAIVQARLEALSRLHVSPLLDTAAATLPLSRVALERDRRALLAVPAWLGAAALVAAAAAQPAPLRWGVLSAWALLALALGWQGSAPRAADDSETAVRRLLPLAIALALSSEVWR